MKFSKTVLESFSSVPSLPRRTHGPRNPQVPGKPFHLCRRIRCDETATSTTDLSHRFLIYRNTVSSLPHNQGFKWTIDLWVLPPTARGQGIGTQQVRYLLQRRDIRILEVGNAANYSFWKRFQCPTKFAGVLDTDRFHGFGTKFDEKFNARFKMKEDSDCRGYMLLKNDTSVDEQRCPPEK
jgi:hypothetical protein